MRSSPATKGGIAAAGLVLALAVLSRAWPAAASTTSTTTPASTAGQVQVLQDDEDAAAAQEVAVETQLQASLSHKKDLDAKVASLDARIAGVQSSLDGAEARLDQLSAQEVAEEDHLGRLEGTLAGARAILSQRAVEAYTNPTATGMADLLLRAHSLQEVSDSSGFMEAVVRAQRAAVKAVEADKALVEAQQRDVDARRDDALQARDKVVSHRAALDAARAEQDATRQQVASEVSTQQELVAQLAAARATYEAEIAALESQSRDLAAILRTTQAGQTPGLSGHGVLMEPVPGAPITSPFGPRVHPIFGDVRMHTGIDFGAPTGTPIHAGADGVVVLAGPYGGYGNATVIDHGGGLATLYGHQSEMLVKVGDHVTRGQVIGLVGCTGSCTGPHVHFEVRLNGTPVDPAGYL